MELIVFDTPVGPMALAEEENLLTHLWLPGQGYPRIAPHETELLAEGKRQLLEYLTGLRREFSLPLGPRGTPFQMEVWRALEAIPYGETITYGELARRIGRPKAVRAVGQANHRNPLSIFIPCHRVVGANGSLTGYGGGLELKQTLLDLERSHL